MEGALMAPKLVTTKQFRIVSSNIKEPWFISGFLLLLLLFLLLFLMKRRWGVSREREREPKSNLPINPDDPDLPSSVSHSPSTQALIAFFLNKKIK